MNVPPSPEKVLVIFVPVFSAVNPLAYSLSLAIPHLLKKGMRCVIVATKADAPAGAEARLLTRGKQSFFGWKRGAANRMAAQLRRELPDPLIVGLPGFPFDADVTMVHFFRKAAGWESNGRPAPGPCEMRRASSAIAGFF